MRLQTHRTPAWATLIACLVCLGGFAAPACASHQGPVFYVDEANPPQDDADGDYHFHSLTAALTQFPNPQEGDTVWLGPGVYEGDITVAVERLTIKATSGVERTTIQGSLSIEAEGVRLIGVSVDAGERPFGVRVMADKVTLEDLFVFGAQTGVLLEGAGPLTDITVTASRLYHNAVGIAGSRLRHVTLANNSVEANQQGGALDDGYKLTFHNNVWTANAGDGFKLSNAYELSVSQERYSANGGTGAVFEAVSQMRIERSAFNHNATAGALWRNVQDSDLAQAAFTGNDADGLALLGRSQNNRIAHSEFSDHGRRAAAGLRLADAAFYNQVSNNRFDQNNVGLFLEGGAQSPGNNAFEANEISNSNAEGIRVEASSGNNVFAKNTLRQNNGVGLYLAGGHDRLLDNRIEQAGADGILLDGASGITVEGNTLGDNRGSGLHLSNGAGNNRVLKNQIVRNHEHGIRLDDSLDNRLEQNRIERNRRHGILAQGGQRLTLSGNRLVENAAWGLYAQDLDTLEATSNTVEGNNLGGLSLRNASGVELEGNAVFDNLHVGLRSEESQVWARRNWWGDPLGPAGVFEGRGNAVVGVGLEHVLPWLPDQPDRVVWASVDGQELDTVGPGETLELDFQDRTGLAVELRDVGLDEQGNRTPLSLGVILLSRYARFSDMAPPPGTLALYGVQVGGFKRGAVQLTANLESVPIPTDPDTLKLWLQTSQGWVPLPGGLRTGANHITGELLASQLKPGLIALAPEGAVSSRSPDASTREAKNAAPVEPLAHASAPASQGDDLPWLSLSLMLLLLGHKARRNGIHKRFKRP